VATDLPAFRYHPDPVATGSVARSGEACDVCGEERGYLYEGLFIAAHLSELSIDSEPTAYLFVCLRCGTHLAYSDFT
jgi:uncharacterized protein CbrC (UPF0167 family)